jgi:hypothetical protein
MRQLDEELPTPGTHHREEKVAARERVAAPAAMDIEVEAGEF